MYLTKLLLDPTHPQARRDLANAYDMHRTLSRVYAEDAHASPQRFLWRLETSTHDTATVLVQSAHQGQWQRLESLPGYLRELSADKQVDLPHWLAAARAYRFRLLANPTVTRDGKRHGLHREDEQLAWLARQAQQHGFALGSAQRTQDERRIAHKGKQRLTVHAVRFDGVLHVVDPVPLAQALTAGIGHAKSLGLGLLSLAPV